MNVWGIHMDKKVGSSPVDKGYVGIGWYQLGDLKQYSASREKFKEALPKYIDIINPAVKHTVLCGIRDFRMTKISHYSRRLLL